MGVVARRLERRARHADRLGGDADAAAFEVGQGDAVTLALLAQAQRGRDTQVVEGQLAGVRGVLAELVLDPHHLVAGRVGGHDERADAALSGIRIGDREDDHHPRVAARSDELLGTVQHVVVTVAAGAGLQEARVGTGLRLGQGEGAEHRTLGQRTEEALLLLGAAELVDRHAADRVVHAHDGRAGAVASGDLLEGHGVGQVPGLRAAPFLGHQHAEEAEVGHLADRLGRETVLAVPVGGERFQPFLGELPRHVTDLDLFFAGNHRGFLFFTACISASARRRSRSPRRRRCRPPPRRVPGRTAAGR